MLNATICLRLCQDAVSNCVVELMWGNVNLVWRVATCAVHENPQHLAPMLKDALIRTTAVAQLVRPIVLNTWQELGCCHVSPEDVQRVQLSRGSCRVSEKVCAGQAGCPVGPATRK